uniref:NADH dehydrogenase subunit 4L n=1 Tax=Naria miliaris TaxID=218001 RepID=UPI0023D7D30E|nr:NADH dehydrogenase subunit 4L [Naria miliaris]WDA98754.1 NADH dehydrogenase subunit 4L [Naria miliaris]
MSTFYLTLISMVGFFMALLTLSLQYKHFLSVLLSLEAATMNLFIMLFALTNNTAFSGQASLILITLGACEASLGLAVLVAVIRSRGNDYVSSFSSQKC